jgi:hypothetical protein
MTATREKGPNQRYRKNELLPANMDSDFEAPRRTVGRASTGHRFNLPITKETGTAALTKVIA